jgi:endoglycosylceramidase
MNKTIAIFVLAIGCNDKGNSGLDESPIEACEIVPPDAGPLTIDGQLILDQNDRRILLRGINTGGRSKFAPFSPFDYAPGEFEAALNTYMDKPVEWGLNVLRVPFSWDGMEPEQGVDDEEFLDRYDQLLDAAAARGLWTIVDFHQDVYSERYCGDGFPLWTTSTGDEPHHDCSDWFTAYLFNDDMKDAWDEFWDNSTGVQDKYKDMWTRMITRQWGRPGVIGFEVINEPGWGHHTMSDWEAEVLSPFYSEMATLVDELAPGAFMLFDGTGMDAVTATTDMYRPAGNSLIFAPHFYDPSVFLGGGDSVDVSDGYANLAAIGQEWNLPVLVGEFGIEHDTDGAANYATGNWDGLDANMMHGTWWEYSAAEEFWNHENLSVVEPDGTERPNLVEPMIRAYPHAIAGELERWHFDAATSVATLAVLAEPDGITEVSIPTRLYPDGPTISGTGACYAIAGQRLLLKPTQDRFEVTIQP